MDAGDAIGEADYGSFSPRFRDCLEILDPLFDQLADFGWIQLGGHGCSSNQSVLVIRDMLAGQAGGELLQVSLQ
jgi:hypothetical protein